MGFGPAGLGLFTAALAAGSFAELMAGDPLVLDRAAGGVGRLGRYAIESDSFVESFVAAILERTDDDDLRPRGPWAEQAVAELAGQVEARRGGPVPLPWAAAVQDVLARMVSAEADRLGHPLTVRRRSEVVAARRTRDGTWLVQWRRSDEDGADVLERAEARNVVLAGGAVQRPADLAGVRLAGVAPWRDLPQRVRPAARPAPGWSSSAARTARWLAPPLCWPRTQGRLKPQSQYVLVTPVRCPASRTDGSRSCTGSRCGRCTRR
ncbi:MAG: hypothetical protein CSB46_03980 [Micrococcales bacterium]|nr:MAG: hypothetical protein CSB46_03980 [Micrococcales bacterium]